jgi:NitT/TauT family transport system substrate-binding protein
MTEGTDYTFLPVGDGGTAAVAFLRDEVNSYAGAVSDAAILASRGLALREITPEAFLGFFGNGIAMLENQMAATPDLAPKFGRALVRGTRFASDPANKEKALAHCAAGNPQEGEQDYAPSLFDGVVNRMTPTDAFISQGFGFQPPEHWQAIHDSAVASGALEAPLRQIAENSGVDGSVVAGKVRESTDRNFGFDAQLEVYGDLMKAGIIDPAKVVRTALEDAASVAGLLITTEAMVAEKPEKKTQAGGGMGGMGGMDDMM